MTTYLTRMQAVALANQIPYTDSTTTFYVQLCNAAIQACRDSLVAGVELPEPVATVKENPFTPEGMSDDIGAYLPNGTKLYTADQLRQAISDALEKSIANDYVPKHDKNS